MLIGVDVHETIQPVVERDVLEPHVIHNTFPIHEIHINEAKHHSASSLPEITLAEFQRQGGTLTGREERVDSFSGAPRSIDDAVTDSQHNKVLGGPGAAGTTTVTGAGLGGSSSGSGGGRTEYTEGYDYGSSGRYESTGSTTQQRSQYDTTGSTQRDYDTTTSSKSRTAAAGAGALGLGGAGAGAGAGLGAGSGGGGLGGSAAQTAASKIPGVNKLTSSRSGESSGARGEEQGKKPSLIDKLNPMKDTNKDGKAGFMS